MWHHFGLVYIDLHPMWHHFGHPMWHHFGLVYIDLHPMWHHFGLVYIDLQALTLDCGNH